MEVGQITESVEVKADAVMVETRATGVGQVINNTQILELPLVGRATQDLITLVGGAVVSGQETATSRSFTNIARFTIAGSSDRGNSYSLDGASHNEIRGGLGLPLPFPDALQEFKVETSALPAQIGFTRARRPAVTNPAPATFTEDSSGSGAAKYLTPFSSAPDRRNSSAHRRRAVKKKMFSFGMPETLDRGRHPTWLRSFDGRDDRQEQ